MAQTRDDRPVSIAELGRDLKAVIDAAAPRGPDRAGRHSMGGMTVMALADAFPGLIRQRVVAVALVCTSSGGSARSTSALPVAGVNAVRRAACRAQGAGQRAELVERGRRATADLFAGIIEPVPFASRRRGPGRGPVRRADDRVDADRRRRRTPTPSLNDHDKTEALADFTGLPVLVLAGVRDLVTPSEHSEAIAGLLPDAEPAVPDAGHLVMLEHPELVTDRLADLLARAAPCRQRSPWTAMEAPSSAGRPG
ncbi:Alpha/beta fold hydrolase OS=Streptomyces tendae OX=1932 GN=GUR47_17010 PE=4 SV=1 [Streptomyces tendae]